MKFAFGDYVVDVDRRELRRGAEPVALEPQVFDLLVYLVANRGRVVSRDDLLGAVWGGRIVSESTITSRINAVRKAIGDSGKAQHLIRTVTRKGVRFVGVVREEETPAEPIGAQRMVENAPIAVVSSDATSAGRLSIVVLPFVNLSSDPEQEYFADAMTDDLTTDLSRISGSFVIARSTAFAYKGTPIDVKQIGRELGVRYVLEGSVRRTSDQVRVNVQLIDAESGAHVWAERFETDRRNLAEAQSEITGRLAWALNMELVMDAAQRIEREKAVDLDGRDLVMRGWASYFRPASSANRHDAQRFFEGALELDPRSIHARVGLAKILISNLVQGWSSAFQQNSACAERLLLEALEQDTRLAKAHATMGQLRRVQNRLTESRSEYEAAIALDPNDDNAYGQLGWTLLFLGQPSAGLAQGEKALQLSPRDPHIWGTYLQLGWCRLLLSQVDQATDLLIHSRTANPRLWVTHFALAAALGLKGDLDGAGAVLVDLLKIKPEVDSLGRFRTYRPWGNPQYWTLFEQTAGAGLRRVGFPDE